VRTVSGNGRGAHTSGFCVFCYGDDLTVDVKLLPLTAAKCALVG
jgi:hypothetical protein